MTRDSERDRSIERMLRATLRAGQTAEPGPSCIDPATLAAWRDGGLRREEVASVEAHTAACPRCQAMLAAMARTTPAAAPRARWRSLLRPVGVPLAAAAAVAIVVAAVVTRNSLLPVEESRQAASSVARDHVLPDEGDAGNVAGFQSDRALQMPPELARRERSQRLGQAPPATDQQAAAAGSAEPPPAAPAQPKAEAARDLSESLAAASESPAALILVRSPDPLRFWRMGPGRVERSTDGGATWITQYAEPEFVPLAGASPSSDVCWIVGRAGLVLLSTDGRTWRQVPFPETVDLTAVRAASGTTATVVTSDGRSFVTTNAGFTWDPASPQEIQAAPF